MMRYRDVPDVLQDSQSDRETDAEELYLGEELEDDDLDEIVGFFWGGTKRYQVEEQDDQYLVSDADGKAVHVDLVEREDGYELEIQAPSPMDGEMEQHERERIHEYLDQLQ